MRRTSLLLLAVLASCASYGTYVSDSKIAQLRRGMTKAEVRAIVGLPQMDMPVGNTREWIYTHSHAQSFVFVTKAESRTVKLVFRKELLDEVLGYDLEAK